MFPRPRGARLWCVFGALSLCRLSTGPLRERLWALAC